MIIMWIIIPIPQRTIDGIAWCPKPIEYDRTNYIARNNNIIVAIDVAIAYNSYCCCSSIFAFDNDRSYILIQILPYHCLNNKQVCAFFFYLHYTQEINIPVIVQIEIRDTIVGVIQPALEIFYIF